MVQFGGGGGGIIKSVWLRNCAKFAFHLSGNNSCTQVLRQSALGSIWVHWSQRVSPRKQCFGSLCFAEQKAGFQNYLHTETAVSLLPSKSLLFPKRVAGLRKLASKLLQDYYKSWQAPSVLPMFLFFLRGPQPPHKAICLRSCWEHANKACRLSTRLRKATCPTPPAARVAIRIWVKSRQSAGPGGGIINRFVSQYLSA